MKNFNAKLLGVCVFVIALATACNRSFDKVVPSAPPFQTVTYKTPKVLYIIADGARGTSVRDGVIPTLTSLLPNSIYSWNGLADGTNLDAKNATNWADMITGVSKDKHNVVSEDFAGNKLNDFPTIFTRIKALRPQTRIASFSTSAAFKTNFSGGVDVSESLANDAALKTRMVDFVKADTASVIVGEFSGIQAAGAAPGSGYDNSFPGYKAAITTFDAQVGDILTALKARTNYINENWVVIIASNKGGAYTLPATQDDKTVFSVPGINTFTIIYNPNFKTTFVPKPFVGNQYAGVAPRFRGEPEKAIATTSTAPTPEFPRNGSDIYNFNTKNSFTISVKVKKHKNPNNLSRGDYFYEWSGFLGKRGNNGNPGVPFTGWGNAGGAGAGWDFCVFQNRWRLLYGGNTVSSEFNGQEPAGLEFSGDTWHDLTAVIEVKADSLKYLRLYTDGVPGITNRNNGSLAAPFVGEYQMPGLPNFDNTSPLRMGYTPGEINGSLGKIDIEIKELKIFKAALPESVVKQYACDQTIDRSHPFYTSLIGYWPCNEGTGNKLYDRAGSVATTGPSNNGMDMTITGAVAGAYTWETFPNDLMCSPPATNFALLVPKNTDIPVQILSWLNIPRQSTWGLSGKVWIAN